jgi:DNA-binding LytR/AlgR family response regulator
VGLVCGEAVHTVICTASDTLAERLKELLLRWACSECVMLSVERMGRFPLSEERSAGLLLLDMDSVELPEHGRRDTEKTGLIVVSRDAGRAIRSYRWHPAAFLKPDFDMRRLSEALGACEKLWQQGRLCLESPYRRRTFQLPLGRVCYVEAAAHYCLFSQGERTARIRFSTNELETLLPNPPFARCHRSYLVHLDAVEGLNYTTLTLRGGVRLPLGRTYIKPLREALQMWRSGEPAGYRLPDWT